MSPGLTIREAGLTDLKSVFAIEKESFPTPWSRWTFLAELNQSLGHFLVAGPSLSPALGTLGLHRLLAGSRRDAPPQPGSAP